VVYLSSWEVFSGYAGDLLVDETVPVLAKGPYGDTKVLSEQLIENFKRTHGLECVVVRSSPVYGADSDRPKFIYNFAAKAEAGEKIVTHRYLNGDAALDLLHIDDLADALVKVLSQPVNGVLHVGTGELTSTFEIAQFLVRTLKSNSEVAQSEIETYTARIAMNIAKASKQLNWKPRVKIWDELTKLVDKKSIR
jgi:nucleoside-diphosphate-sugar epimerase